jgi:hypothetical protein
MALDPGAAVTSLIAREVMLARDVVARAAALAASESAQRWMLSQPREVRASYVRDVMDTRGGEREQRIWMLRQSDAVRHSYLLEVAGPAGAHPEVHWLLNQSQEVRESYLVAVLGAKPQPPRPRLH